MGNLQQKLTKSTTEESALETLKSLFNAKSAYTAIKTEEINDIEQCEQIHTSITQKVLDK